MAKEIVIVVPALNEEKTLADKIEQVQGFLRENLDSYEIIIADNDSTDRTPELARQLASEHLDVLYHHVAIRGKGSAIKRTWLDHDYEIYSFMDVDLSTDLNAFPALIEAVKSGYDLAVGSRYIEGAHTERSFKRETISRTYRALFSLLFRPGIHDPQCGFKAISRKVRDQVLAQVETDGFFFDSELLIRAYHRGFSIKEVPINWTEEPDSTVNFLRDVPRFLKGLASLKYLEVTGRLVGK
jgi:glycosyltransferase involved in cell wall biosynthesis